MDCVLLVALCLPAFAQAQDGPPNNEEEFEAQYKERITKDRLNGVYIPKNLDDAMRELDRLTSPEGQEKFRSIPAEEVCQLMHKRLGQWIMTNWGFYGGSRLSHYLKSAGITYPDDMADFIIIAYHMHLHGESVPIKELAVSFKEKRQKEYQERMKQGEVIHEEVRKKEPDEKTEKNGQ